MQDQPIHVDTQGLIADKFLYGIHIASTNSFLNFGISLPTTVTSIYLNDIRENMRVGQKSYYWFICLGGETHDLDTLLYVSS